MATGELLIWMRNNLALDYDDLDSIEPTLDRWTRRARALSDDERWRSFEAAIRGGLKDQYIDFAIDLRDDIEKADFRKEIPLSDVDSTEEFFRVPLQEGMTLKIGDLDTRWGDTLSGELEDVDREVDIDRIIRRAEQIELPQEMIDKLDERGKIKKQLIGEEPIKDLLRKADTAEAVTLVEIPETLSPETQRRLKQFRGLREAEERVEDFVGETAERWQIGHQLTGEMMEIVDAAKRADDLFAIDPSLIPTKSGQKEVRRAIDRRIRDLTSE